MPAYIDELQKGTIGFLPFPQQQDFLAEELRDRFHIPSDVITNAKKHGDIWIFPPEVLPCCLHGPAPTATPYWCRLVLLEPFYMKFTSIGEAAGALRQIQRNWAAHPTTAFRRSTLIQEKLPYINLRPRTFPVRIPQQPMGIYSLLDNNTILASAATTSIFPCGTLEFKENHDEPPSRAYLKFQEALTTAMASFGRIPGNEDRCLDAGACPGGWTWVLRQLGCKVIAVDRSELAPTLMADPLVQFIRHDAFTMTPQELGEFDWVCSDVICYPERLLKWIYRWLESGMCHNMICTIKMQGKTDWNLIDEFAAIPDSLIRHMNYNKHELTWIHCET